MRTIQIINEAYNTLRTSEGRLLSEYGKHKTLKIQHLFMTRSLFKKEELMKKYKTLPCACDYIKELGGTTKCSICILNEKRAENENISSTARPSKRTVG